MKFRLGYVVRFASDVDRSVRFYRDVLGLEVEHRDEGYAALRTEGPVTLALLARDRLPELLPEEECAPPPSRRHEGELAFLVEDVDAACRRLRDAGLEPLAPPADRSWGERTAYFTDPDGHLLELTQRL